MNIMVNGNEISVFSNRSDNPAVIFLHGNSLSSTSFVKQFDSEMLNKFHLVGIDFPGHGKSYWSRKPEKDYNLFHFRDVVVEVFARLKIDSFVLAGHSIGGHVAMECLPYLKNCKGLAIWGAPPVKLPLDLSPIFLPNPLQHLLFTKNLNENDISALASLFVKQEYSEPISEIIRQCDPEFRGHFPGSLAQLMISDEYQLLVNSRLPVAILHGDGDQLINRDYYNTIEIPGLWRNSVLTIENAGHTPQLESPEIFNELLFQFVSETFKI